MDGQAPVQYGRQVNRSGRGLYSFSTRARLRREALVAYSGPRATPGNECHRALGGGESYEEHLKRFDEEYKKVRKEFKARMALHFGTRKGNQPAKWTAMRFTFPTFADVARRVDREEDVVRKAITAFARRTHLTLPT